MTDELNLLPTPDDLASAVATALINRIQELQSESSDRVVELCLTGGTIAVKVHERFAANLAEAPVDYQRINIWWGDERFVPTDSADRNAEPAISLLTAAGIPPAHLHPMPASVGLTLEGAAEHYASELGDTVFDICMLGLGPDGHIASMFPGHPSSEPTQAKVIPVTNSPKPPPDRVSLTFNVINASSEIWFMITGEGKAEAAAKAYRHDPSVPGGRAQGQDLTVYWIDTAAAADLQD